MSNARNIVITGASGGIGAALAIRLGADGHRVALAAVALRYFQDVGAFEREAGRR